MTSRIILFFVAVIIICACQDKKIQSYTESSYKKTHQFMGKHAIRLDSLRIPNPFSEEPFGNYTTCYHNNDTAFLVLENCANKQFNVFNLSDFSSFSLNEENLKCGQSHSVCFQSPNHFYKLEANGDLLEFKEGNYTLIDNFTTNTQLKYLGLWAGGFLDYSNNIDLLSDSTLMIPLDVNPDLKDREFSKYDYGYPITGVYNLKTKKISYEGLTYPKFLFENNYGILTKIEQYCFKGNILYSFVPIPEIWKYNHDSKTVDRFLVKSIFDTIATPALSFKRSPKTKDLLFQHFKTSPYYSHLIYNPYCRLFYRFYALPLPEKSADGLYTTYKDRRYSVMVLDEEFNLLSEALLPKDCFFIYFAVPASDGFHINYGPFIETKQHGIKTLRIQLLDVQ